MAETFFQGFCTDINAIPLADGMQSLIKLLQNQAQRFIRHFHSPTGARKLEDGLWPSVYLCEGAQGCLWQRIGGLITEGIHLKATEPAFLLVYERAERWR